MSRTTRSLVRLAERHLTLVAVCTLVGLLVGAAWGITRPATYQAESRLLVGTFEVPAAAIPAYVLNSQTLAQNYEQLATTQAVLQPLAQALGVSQTQAAAAASIQAIPQTAIIRVTATSTSAAEAKKTANAAAKALSDAVAGINAPASGQDLLNQHQQAAADLAAAETAKTAAQNQLTALTAANASQAQIAAAQKAVDDAEAARSTAALREQTLADQYKALLQQTSTSSDLNALGDPVVTKVSKVTSTAIDSVVGAVLGLAVGLLLAWRRERSAASPAPGADGDALEGPVDGVYEEAGHAEAEQTSGAPAT